MTTEMLGTKEDLHEVDWVKEQTKSALADLQKEMLYTKNGDEVKFDVDTSLDYLKTLKDKKTYREVMAQNSGATVMAVQILLKNKGYNIGKIDGILKGNGKSISKTMEAIAKFQSDNGLTPDGAPGPDTLKKILEVYENGGNSGGNETVEEVSDITEEKFLELERKTSLTDNEVKEIVKFSNNTPWTISIQATSITDRQAEILSTARCGIVFLDVTKITDRQAESLSKIEELHLNKLTRITDKQAEFLSKVSFLDLEGVTLTLKQKEILRKHIS